MENTILFKAIYTENISAPFMSTDGEENKRLHKIIRILFTGFTIMELQDLTLRSFSLH
jgi:hypothetical protein